MFGRRLPILHRKLATQLLLEVVMRNSLMSCSELFDVGQIPRYVGIGVLRKIINLKSVHRYVDSFILSIMFAF